MLLHTEHGASCQKREIMTPQARTREFETPRYTPAGRDGTRGAVWRPERADWDGGDVVAGEIRFDVADEPVLSQASPDLVPDPFDAPTLRLR